MLKPVVPALGILVLSAVIVFLGRDGYRDSSGKPIGWLTAVYYATVTLSTTGYGDVEPSSDSARLINTLVVTPLRVMFLLVWSAPRWSCWSGPPTPGMRTRTRGR